MKTKFLTLIPLIFLLISSCKKNEEKPEVPLPPATQIGANTLGCKINGVNWVANGEYEPNKHVFSGGLYRMDTSANYGSHAYKTAFSFSAFKLDGTSMYFQIPCEPKIGTYLSNNTSFSYYTKEYHHSEFFNSYNYRYEFQTDSTHQGSLTITYYNLNKYIVSGTFQFDAVNYETGQEIHVTDGRFDMNLCTMY